MALSPQIGLNSSSPIALVPSFTIVTSLAAPVGSYIVTAKVVLTNGSAGTTPVTCVLTSSGGSAFLDRSDVVLADGGTQTLSLHTAMNVTFFLGEHIRVACEVGAAGAVAFASNEQLTAIQAQTLTATGP